MWPFLKRWRRWLGLALSGAVLLVLLKLPPGLRRGLADSLTPPLAMVLRAPARVASAGRSAWFRLLQLGRTEEENQQLRRQVMLLRLENGRLQESLRASGLKDKAGMDGLSASDLIPARILARDPSSWFDYVTLNKGRDEGVRWGTGVLSEDGVVGKVASVTPVTCKVVLLVDPACRLAVRDQRSQVSSTLAGDGRRACQLLYLSGSDDVRPGDLIETAEEGTIFPQGVPVGRVARVEKKENGLVLAAEVKPFARLTQLESLYLIGRPPAPAAGEAP